VVEAPVQDKLILIQFGVKNCFLRQLLHLHVSIHSIWLFPERTFNSVIEPIVLPFFLDQNFALFKPE